MDARFETFGELPCPLLRICFALTPSYLDTFRKGLEIDIVAAIGLKQPEDQHDGYTRHRRQAKGLIGRAIVPPSSRAGTVASPACGRSARTPTSPPARKVS